MSSVGIVEVISLWPKKSPPILASRLYRPREREMEKIENDKLAVVVEDSIFFFSLRVVEERQDTLTKNTFARNKI